MRKTLKCILLDTPVQYAREWYTIVCWNACRLQDNVPSKCFCVISLLLTAMTFFQSVPSSQLFLIKRHYAPLLSVRRREITQVHYTCWEHWPGMHFRTQWCITIHKWKIFRPVSAKWCPQAWSFRPGPRAGRPVASSSTNKQIMQCNDVPLIRVRGSSPKPQSSALGDC